MSNLLSVSDIQSCYVDLYQLKNYSTEITLPLNKNSVKVFIDLLTFYFSPVRMSFNYSYVNKQYRNPNY